MSAPRLEIHHGYALLHLVLSTVLSYENRAAHHRIPYLRFDTVLTARVTKLSVEPDDDEGHRYTWTARFEITELEVSRQPQSSPYRNPRSMTSVVSRACRCASSGGSSGQCQHIPLWRRFQVAI